jgi:uncharacterized protein YxjI
MTPVPAQPVRLTAMPNLYALHQSIFSFGGDAWIEDENGGRAFEVDGHAFALGRTLDLLDPSGTLLYTIHAPILSFQPTFEISRDDATVATIRKALFTLFASRFAIELAAGGELEAEGNFLDHEFRVNRGDEEVIGASRAWFSMHDTYGVRVDDGFEPALALSLVIAIEQMVRPKPSGPAFP